MVMTMIDKKRTNHHLYIHILRRISPEHKILKSFELSAFCKDLFFHGLKKRNPDLRDEELLRLYRERLDQCQNRNY